jgi:hypothetical protein
MPSNRGPRFSALHAWHIGEMLPESRARARGRGGGHAPIIGFVQPFTQECLNHDVCCDKTKGSPPICGSDCLPAFYLAEAGYTNAPDCGTTGRNWEDSNANIYGLAGGDSDGDPETFTGFFNSSDPFCAHNPWLVTGTRTGPQISFTATNPSPPDILCPLSSYTVTGTYSQIVGRKLPPTDNNACNTATGTWSDSSGKSGNWNWIREGDVLTSTVLSSRDNAGPTPTDK